MFRSHLRTFFREAAATSFVAVLLFGLLIAGNMFGQVS